MTKQSLPALFPVNYIPLILEDVFKVTLGLVRPAKGKTVRSEEALTADVLKKLHRIERYRVGPLEPHIESWLPDLKHRADIRFSCGKGIETYFLVEAKRLCVRRTSGQLSNLITPYIDNGVMRFVSRVYAPFQASSMMLGYVFDDTVLNAEVLVSRGLQNQRLKLKLKQPLQKSTEHVAYQTTIHSLDIEFTLFHLFVKIE